LIVGEHNIVIIIYNYAQLRNNKDDFPYPAVAVGLHKR